MPARSGPRNEPAPSPTPDATFAATSSSGVRAMLGIAAICIGRTNAPADEAIVAPTRTAIGWPAASPRSVASEATARSACASRRSRTAGRRPARRPARGAPMIDGVMRMAVSSPTAVAPP